MFVYDAKQEITLLQPVGKALRVENALRESKQSYTARRREHLSLLLCVSRPLFLRNDGVCIPLLLSCYGALPHMTSVQDLGDVYVTQS